MPTIADFGGFKCTMYYDDHNPPHFHVLGPEWQAVFAVADGRLLRGSCPPAAARVAKEWAAENKAFLLAKWTELNERDD